MGASNEVEEWLERYDNPMRPVVSRIREAILAADERIGECIKWQAPTFNLRSNPKANLASFFPKSKAHASLMFHEGASIPGSFPRLEGDGAGRVLKLASLAEVKAAERELVKIVRAYCDWKSAPKSTPKVKAPAAKAPAAQAPAAKAPAAKAPAAKAPKAKVASKAQSEFGGFPAATLTFLRGLTKNNDKAWFDAHRADYDDAYVQPAMQFVMDLGPRLKKFAPEVQFEPRVNGSLMRINRDIRFSKDKTPYKNHLDLWFWVGDRRGWNTPGFFFRLLPDRWMIGVGMHQFEKEALASYREAVLNDASGAALANVVKSVRAHGYGIGGATRNSVPRGLPADHVRKELLLHEGLFTEYLSTSVKEIHEPNFAQSCAEHLKKMWPIGAWLSRSLMK